VSVSDYYLHIVAHAQSDASGSIEFVGAVETPEEMRDRSFDPARIGADARAAAV
jgi:hypothetical protein